MQYHNIKNLMIFIIVLIGGGNLEAQIRVNLPQNPQITPVAPAIRGYNQGDFDWLPWNEVDFPPFRREFAGLLPGIIRWPGGTGANNYVWQDYVHDDTRFHLVNAVEFIRDMGIGLQYMVNFGNGSASEAADLIRLCNSHESYWQNKRASLFGSPDPVNVKIWELGNENNYTHAWVSAWFGRAHDNKIHFRNNTSIDFPADIADSLYFYGGEIWRGGWVDPTTIEVHQHKTEAILGEKYLVQPDDGDTLVIPVSYPKIGTDSINVWAVDTTLTEAELDYMSLQEIYDLITVPRYLLSANYFTILGDTAVMVYLPARMDPGELIYVEYQSVGHDGAFAFRDAIKAADPMVQVGYSVWPNERLLNQSFFRHDFVQSPPDFVIQHTYPNDRDIELLADNKYFSEILYLPQQLVQYIIAGQDYIDSVSTNLGLPLRLGIAITEWSYAINMCKECDRSRFDGIIGATNTAMFAASYMEAMHNSSINLVALNFFTLAAKWGGGSIYDITPGSLNLVITSRAHAMRMLSNTIGTKFFTIDSANIAGNPMISIFTKNPNGSIQTISVPAVKMWGGIDSLHHDYSMLLINQDDSLNHSVTFHVPTAWSVDTVYVERMTGIPNTSVYNLEKETLPIVNNSVQITLPAFSLTALRFGSIATRVETNPPLAMSYSLENAYPNPFNPSTTILFTIPHREYVTLKVFDMLGREVAALVDGELNPGEHSVVFDAKDLASGVYFYRLTAGTFSETKPMEVIK